MEQKGNKKNLYYIEQINSTTQQKNIVCIYVIIFQL